jgi:hypothetical protein
LQETPLMTGDEREGKFGEFFPINLRAVLTLLVAHWNSNFSHHTCPIVCCAMTLFSLSSFGSLATP